jgi:hypothetical protein
VRARPALARSPAASPDSDTAARCHQVFELICAGKLAEAAAEGTSAWPPPVLTELADVAKGCLLFHAKRRKAVLDVLPQVTAQ